MKKMRLLPAVFVATLLLGGCAAQKSVEPLKEMPSMAQLTEFYDSHSEKQNTARAEQVKAKIDETSQAELLQILDDSLQRWAKEQTLLELDHATVNGSTDPLLMNENQNEKTYHNLLLKVGVFYDPQKIKGNEKALADQIFEQVPKALKETPYGAYKINTVEIICYGLSGAERFQSTALTLTKKEEFLTEQSAEEQNLQTIAYDAVAQWNKEYCETFTDAASQKEFAEGRSIITLRRFGFDPSSKSLTVEIPVAKANFEQDVSTLETSFEEKSKVLYDQILQDKDATAYLKKSGARSAHISINTPWAGYFNYDYEFDF